MQRFDFVEKVVVLVLVAWVGGMWLYRKTAQPPSQELMRVFNDLYNKGHWGRDAEGRCNCGPGSSLEATKDYRAFVEEFMRRHEVRSVVDAGCGDWTFSSAMDWSHVSYLGVDIASDVVDTLKKKYSRPNVSFMVGDITDELPAADLLLCKDVLEHLPSDMILKFISSNLKKGRYKWAIITNDRGRDNHDIKPGEHRLIDLTVAPFTVRGLVDLPVKFGDQVTKVAQLLDLS